MKEPKALWELGLVSSVIPYSQLNARHLGMIASDNITGNGPESSEPDFDPDFRRRYAAILLEERGG